MLKGGDIDLKAGIVYVRRMLSDARGQVIKQPLKNVPGREVPQPEHFTERLRQRKLRAGEEGYIFTTQDGFMIRHSNSSKRVWKPIPQSVGSRSTFESMIYVGRSNLGSSRDGSALSTSRRSWATKIRASH